MKKEFTNPTITVIDIEKNEDIIMTSTQFGGNLPGDNLKGYGELFN